MKPSFATVQTLVAVLALCISTFAAFFAWRQVETTQAHNRLSVAPMLRVVPYAEGETGRNGLYVTNVGLGPAIITKFSVKAADLVADGFESDKWPEILASVGAQPFCFATAWPKEHSVVKAGQELPFIYITRAEGYEICYMEMIRLMGGKGIEVTIGYDSIYEESREITESSQVKSTTIQALHQQLFGKD